MFLLFTMSVFFLPHISAYDNDDIEIAKKSYQAGLAAFSAKKWHKASKHFRESFGKIPHSMTAYMISVTYLEMESLENALAYAEKADTCKPELKEPYSNAIKDIRAWARQIINDPSYTLSGMADGIMGDEVKQKLFQKHLPPQPDIPQDYTLEIEPALDGNTIKLLNPVKVLPLKNSASSLNSAQSISIQPLSPISEGFLGVTVNVNPSVLAPGQKTKVLIHVKDTQGRPLQQAEVSLYSGGGKYSRTGTTTVSGSTDESGNFVAYWFCESCAPRYVSDIKIKKEGHNETNAQWSVKIH
jgi:hypothetical protein